MTGSLKYSDSYIWQSDSFVIPAFVLSIIIIFPIFYTITDL